MRPASISKLTLALFLALYIAGQFAIAEHSLHHDDTEHCSVCISYGQPVLAGPCHDLVIKRLPLAHGVPFVLTSAPQTSFYSSHLQRGPPYSYS
ncbi:hypothetical protein SAMN02745866_02550 [Alteromonadaceae bacterium Bs31]|nr:hypothetical protein SAMN02745866_02550 [Alteromonadaceae bacterium Bs31]